MPAYVRLAVSRMDRNSHCPTGVFIASSELRDSDYVPPELVDRIISIREWFNEHLPAPDEVDSRAIFWFKPGAGEPMRMIWKLAELLDEGGYPVSRATCRNPGKVVYEDDYQVAAIPFRETRRRLRSASPPRSAHTSVAFAHA